MFGEILTGLNGMCIRYNGELHVIKGIGGNPYIDVREFNAMLHTTETKQVYLPGDLYCLLDLLVKRNGREAFA